MGSFYISFDTSLIYPMPRCQRCQPFAACL